jgi:hypothetical protein
MVGKSAPQEAGDDQAHGAAGTHAQGVQVIRVEEIMGVGAGVLLALLGMAVATNVALLASCNPTSTGSVIFARVRAEPTLWSVYHFSQADHVNVRLRREEIPGCVSHLDLEAALRSVAFERRGLADKVELDPDRLDFVYALPDPDLPDKPGPREDGIPGHPDAIPQVFRPTSGVVAGLRLGYWLEADAGALLYDVQAIGARMASGSWRQPDGNPDRVGFDAAQSRPPVACGAWGPTAREAYDQASALAKAGKDPVVDVIACDKPTEIPWEGEDKIQKDACAAGAMVERYGKRALYIGDDAFGRGIGTVLANLGCRVELVAFGGAPVSEPIDIYGRMKTRRAEMHSETAAACNGRLVALPHDERLLEEMRATGPLLVSKDKNGARTLGPKKDAKKAVGRELDALDSLVLANAGGRKPFFW